MFEAWRPDDQADWLLRCCVVTTTPNALMMPLHDRMPAILAPPQSASLLGHSTQDSAFLAPAATVPTGFAQAWPVARAVGQGRA